MKTVKKCACLLLTVLLLYAGLPRFALPAGAAAYQRGDIVAFGRYPQAPVTDEALLAALEATDPAPTWQPIGYSADAASEYAFYRDVDYEGETYRAIYFTQANSNAQARYGYAANTVYWFRFTPIEWTVLDPDAGLLIANAILDTRPFANTVYNRQYADEENRYYLNNYAHSSIRAWLNGAFTGAAFSAEEAAVLVPREQDNSVSEMEAAISRYACENTNDPVFLLSYAEASNADWFPTDADRVEPSAVSVSDGAMSISFTGDSAFSYHLLATDSLSPTNWYDFGATNVGADALQSFEIPIDAGHPQRFFKIETIQRNE